MKPIVEIKQPGRIIAVNFTPTKTPYGSLRYDISINGSIVQYNIFAEEVMRWLAVEIKRKHLK